MACRNVVTYRAGVEGARRHHRDWREWRLTRRSDARNDHRQNVEQSWPSRALEAAGVTMGNGEAGGIFLRAALRCYVARKARSWRRGVKYRRGRRAHPAGMKDNSKPAIIRKGVENGTHERCASTRRSRMNYRGPNGVSRAARLASSCGRAVASPSRRDGARQNRVYAHRGLASSVMKIAALGGLEHRPPLGALYASGNLTA